MDHEQVSWSVAQDVQEMRFSMSRTQAAIRCSRHAEAPLLL